MVNQNLEIVCPKIVEKLPESKMVIRLAKVLKMKVEKKAEELKIDRIIKRKMKVYNNVADERY